MRLFTVIIDVALSIVKHQMLLQADLAARLRMIAAR